MYVKIFYICLPICMFSLLSISFWSPHQLEWCCICFIYLIAAYFGVWWAYAGWYRGKLRAQYGLPESPLPDCLTHLFCHWCALAQEHRELAARGYNVLNGTYSLRFKIFDTVNFLAHV